MDQAIECHVHPTWAEASPKVSINLKSENPQAGNQREPSRTLMPVINKVSPHLHYPAGSRPLWRSQASSQPAPASSHFVPQLLSDPKELVSLQGGDLCNAFFSIICTFHLPLVLPAGLQDSASLLGSGLWRIMWLWLFAFFILCAGFFQFLKNWYHYGVVTCGNILLHLFNSARLAARLPWEDGGGCNL